jgi:hypothetical protein
MQDKENNIKNENYSELNLTIKDNKPRFSIISFLSIK